MKYRLTIFKIFSYQPSKADTSVFDNLGNAPANTFINILRWYNNIASYSQAERSGFTGQSWSVKGNAKKPAPAPAKAAADDDDVDLFASDEDEVHTDSFIFFK